MPQVIFAHHPLTLKSDRAIVKANSGCTIRNILTDNDIEQFERPTICSVVAAGRAVNDSYVLQSDWGSFVPPDESTVIFLEIPQGGGEGGSNPLRAIMMIALMVAAPYLAPMIAGVTGVSTAIATAGVMMVGNAVINAVLPPETPNVKNTSLSDRQASPTYSIQGQQNTARLEQPIPVIYGTHVVYHDYAAKPYVRYINNDQYLYLTLMVAMGECSLSHTRIEETDIESYSNSISKQVIRPGDSNFIFDPNIYTSKAVNNLELLAPNELGYDRQGGFIINPAGTQIDEIIVLVAAQQGAFYTEDNSSLTPLSMEYELFYRPVDDAGNAQSDWENLASTSTIQAERVSTVSQSVSLAPTTADAATGQLVYQYESTQANVRGIAITSYSWPFAPTCDSGNYDDEYCIPLSSTITHDPGTRTITVDITWNRSTWDMYRNEVITAALEFTWDETYFPDSRTLSASATRPNDAVIDTLKWPVTPGRYEIYMQRLDNKDTRSRAVHTLHWLGLQGRLTGTIDNSECTLLQVAIRASESLNQTTSHKINSIVQRRLPNLEQSAVVRTNEISAAVADVLRNSTYGAGLVDARLNTVELAELESHWTSKGDQFNAIFDSFTTVGEALRVMLLAGRATHYQSLGQFHFYRDRLHIDGQGNRDIPVAHFHSGNTREGSMSLKRIPVTAETAEIIDGEYFAAGTWAPRHVQSQLDDAPGTNTQSVLLVGVTNQEQAKRNTYQLALNNRYHRRIVSFNTEMAGFIPKPGDLIAVTQSLLVRSESSAYQEAFIDTLLNQYPTFVVFGFDRDINWSESDDCYIRMLMSDGISVENYRITRGSTDRNGVLNPRGDADLLWVRTTNDLNPTKVLIEQATDSIHHAIVMSATPVSEMDVAITAVIEEPSLYDICELWMDWSSNLSASASGYDSVTGANTVNFSFDAPACNGSDLTGVTYDIKLVGHKGILDAVLAEVEREFVNPVMSTATSGAFEIGNTRIYNYFRVEVVASNDKGSWLSTFTFDNPDFEREAPYDPDVVLESETNNGNELIVVVTWIPKPWYAYCEIQAIASQPNNLDYYYGSHSDAGDGRTRTEFSFPPTTTGYSFRIWATVDGSQPGYNDKVWEGSASV